MCTQHTSLIWSLWVNYLSNKHELVVKVTIWSRFRDGILRLHYIPFNHKFTLWFDDQWLISFILVFLRQSCSLPKFMLLIYICNVKPWKCCFPYTTKPNEVPWIVKPTCSVKSKTVLVVNKLLIYYQSLKFVSTLWGKSPSHSICLRKCTDPSIFLGHRVLLLYQDSYLRTNKTSFSWWTKKIGIYINYMVEVIRTLQ